MTAVNFPLNPTNEQTFVVFDKTYVYNSAKGVWNIASVAGSEGSTGATQVYELISQLPLSSVNTGAQAFVEENNRLYIWTGAGWFNIALINTNPTITQGPNPSYVFATDGTPIVITLLASDPEGIPITWSFQVTGGTLGDTAVITQDGNVFTITPSTSDEDIGSFSVTFTASDGVNIATAASSFTLVFAAADQFYNQSIVLTTSSVNNGNNNVFVDSGTNNFAITRNGNTTQGTFSPYSPAGWSGFFDGNNDYLTPAANAAFTIGTGDFTYECWINRQGVNPINSLFVLTVFDTRPAEPSIAPCLFWSPINNELEYYVNGSTRITSTSTFSIGVWAHVAIVRSSGITKMYVNGVQEGSNYTDNNNYIGTITVIGGRFAAVSGDFRSWFGYISSARIVKGTALYTANFTPPTEPLTAVTGTSLLTLQDNRFVDRSTNNFAITRFGDTRITPFSPFIPQTPYSPSVHGASAYFDGDGDFLSIPSNAAFNIVSGDFTIETWFYWTGVNTNFKLVEKDGVFGTSYSQYVLGASNSTLVAGVGSGNGISYVQDISTGVSAPVRQWTHIAFTKSGTTLRVFVNGILAVTATQSGTMVDGGKSLIVGYISGQPTSHFFDGYMTGTRIIKGTALYTANFTPPTTPVTAVANTSLLLNFTNSNIFDETGKVVLETVGDAKVSTSVVKYGDGSVFFPGTSTASLVHALSVPASPVYDIGGCDFTLECWVYATSVQNFSRIVNFNATWSAAGAANLLFITDTQRIGFSAFDIANPIVQSNSTYQLNRWYHIAVVREGNVFSMFIDGIKQTSTFTTSSRLWATQTPFMTIGNSPTSVGGFSPMTGFISDLRITKGHARYTANFTPPTAKLGYNNAE